VRKFIIAGVVFLLFVIWFSSCTTRIDPGHVGIRVRLAGETRGVQDTPTVTGWVFYNALTETVIEFPTRVQNVTWTRDSHEGSPTDESITFASTEGVSVNADVGLSFHIERDKAPLLYNRFREKDITVLTKTYVRNAVRDGINEAASTMPVQEIYGVGKTRLLAAALRIVRERLGPDGFAIDQLTFVSALRLPDNVVGAINRAMEATQNAIQAENRVRQIRAEAEQNVEQARGLAEAARQRAHGEADAVLIRAQAEAQANEILRLSVNPSIVQYRMLDRWDGKLPVVNGSGTLPMLTIDTTQVLQLPEVERRARLQQLLGGSSAAEPNGRANPANPTNSGTGTTTQTNPRGANSPANPTN